MIVYVVICRAKDAAILVEFTTEEMTSGNAPQVTTALLEHLRDHPAVMQEGDLKTFVHRNEGDGEDFFSQFLQACTVAVTTADDLDLGSVQEHYFHLWHRDGVFYCCLSDDADPREQKVNFAFLQALARDFAAKYTARRIKNCSAYAMDKDFRSNVRSVVHYYNINHTKLSRDQKINELMTKVESMKDVLGRNIRLMIEREAKLDSLMEKSEQTRRDSQVFYKQSNKLKQVTQRKNQKMWCLIFLTGVVFLWVILASSCGLKFEKCGASAQG